MYNRCGVDLSQNNTISISPPHATTIQTQSTNIYNNKRIIMKSRSSYTHAQLRPYACVSS